MIQKALALGAAGCWGMVEEAGMWGSLGLGFSEPVQPQYSWCL